MKRNKGDDSEEWSVMSTEGFEMMNGTAIFSDFGCGLTHGCGMRTERRNTVGYVIRVRDLNDRNSHM